MTKKRLRANNNCIGIVSSLFPISSNIRISFLILVLTLMPNHVFAQQDFFPFLGKITVESVHVRAGQSTNFESLGKIKKEDRIVVVDKSYSWYKIQLPETAKSYLTSEYVKLINSKVGEVTAKRVNVRAGSGINFSVLGQVNKGDRVVISEHLDGWYKIQPIPRSYGWVSDQFIEFVSNDISGYEPEELDIVLLSDLADPVPDVSSGTTQALSEEPADDEPQTIFKGVLAANNESETNDFQYILINSTEGKYYLDGFSQLLNPFLNYQVKIEGYLKDVDSDAYAYPVVVVTRIQLIL